MSIAFPLGRSRLRSGGGWSLLASVLGTEVGFAAVGLAATAPLWLTKVAPAPLAPPGLATTLSLGARALLETSLSLWLLLSLTRVFRVPFEMPYSTSGPEADHAPPAELVKLARACLPHRGGEALHGNEKRR